MIRKQCKPGVLSLAVTLEMQATLRLIPASGTFFREDLVMKIFLRPFFLFVRFKKSGCQLMTKECMLNTGKVPLGGLPRNRVVRIT